MKLTPENKAIIDAKTYRELLYGNRFNLVGDPWFQDETGEYWQRRMNEMRGAPGGHEQHVTASKAIGWD